MGLSYYQTMPAPKRMCPKGGCSMLVEIGKGCPPECRRSEEPRRPLGGFKHRASAAARGYDRSWQVARAGVVAQQHTCAYCDPIPVMTIAEVHHIIPLSMGGPRLDRWNLLGLCSDCHGKITGSKSYHRCVAEAVCHHGRSPKAAAQAAAKGREIVRKARQGAPARPLR